jgi:hypothetical protein
MKLTIIIFALLFVPACAMGQRVHTSNSNTWLAYIGDHKFSEKFGVHFELQERRNQVLLYDQQRIIRVGINYHFLDNAFVTVGYAFVETLPYGKFAVKSNFPEQRIYQQLQYSNGLGRVELVSRFRLEQRFSYLPKLQIDGSYKSNSSPTYTNRFRFFQRFSIPFKGLKIVDKSIYVTAYDELFVNFGKNVGVNIFDQNRAFIGVGYKIPKIGRLEIGYLNQILVKSDGLKIEDNHTISIALNANFELKKRKK